MKFPVKFLEDYREVELTGEAYFDVSPQKSRPFIINTVGLDVKVLGTRLNVNAYQDQKFQAFTLESGLIELFKREKGEEVTVLKMKPGQHAVYALTDDQLDQASGDQAINEQKTIVIGEQTLAKTIDKISKNKSSTASEKIDPLVGKVNIGFKETSLYTDWKDGKLVLRNDPMPVMLKRIERWYNVRFNVTDERINEYRYWATFEEENMDQVIMMLSLTGPIRFEKRPRELMDDGSFKAQEIDIIMKNK